MSTFLNEIFQLKRQRVEQAKAKRSIDQLKANAVEVRKNAKHFALSTILKNSDKIHVIAEIKRASPSKGIINDKIDISKIACVYEQSGAAAISVLTEEDRFKGSLEDLRTVRENVALPILRKDFIFDEFQIYEAAEAGADVVLLIVAMLDDETLRRLHNLIEEELKMDALVEVHTLDELKRAESIGATLIGVNNRDLHSFKVSLNVSRELIKHTPINALMVTESGLQTREDLQELKDLGFQGFLVGETLMKAGDAEKTLRELISKDASNDLSQKGISSSVQ